jgi:hypothetical protein
MLMIVNDEENEPTCYNYLFIYRYIDPHGAMTHSIMFDSEESYDLSIQYTLILRLTRPCATLAHVISATL